MAARNDAAPETRRNAQGGEPRCELFDLLRRDHARLMELFDQVQSCPNSEMDPLLKLFFRLEEELQEHLEGEERFFYTALEKHDEARQAVLEGYEVHHLATMMIGGFNSLALDDMRWDAKIRVLRRLVELHVDLQESELFPHAAALLDDRQMHDIAMQFMEVKRGGMSRRAGLDAPR